MNSPAAAEEKSLAMVLRGARAALRAEHRPLPEPAAGEVRLRVRACAVCRTDLHLQDGDLPMARWPVVPGHEVVGTVEAPSLWTWVVLVVSAAATLVLGLIPGGVLALLADASQFIR